jgi:RNA polymerase sigma-70 factor (sigma-E family)
MTGTFEAAYTQHRPAMMRLAHLLTGSVAIGEDIVQDAFVQLHLRWASIDNPGGYLRSSVVNLARSHHRRRVLELRRAEASPVLTHDPEIDATWAELRKLPLPQREVIVLRYYLDLPVDEIAELTGRPAGTIKSQIHRALATLQEVLR